MLGFLFPPLRKPKKTQWKPLRVTRKHRGKKQTLILCGKIRLYFLFLENLLDSFYQQTAAWSWQAKRFVLKEGAVGLKYHLFQSEKYAWNMLRAVKHLPGPSKSP